MASSTSRRHSAPTPAATLSPRGSLRNPGSQTGGWEYPLSREEKKQRVMYLFQQELAEAERGRVENLEALQSVLEKRASAKSEALTDGSGTPAAAADSNRSAAAATAPGVAASGNGIANRGVRLALEVCGLIVIAVLLAGWRSSSAVTTGIAMPGASCSPEKFPSANVTYSPVGSGSANVAYSALSANVSWPSDDSEMALAVAVAGANVSVPFAPPNISDRALGMRREGHIRLTVSNCVEAEWWFSSALKLLVHDGNMSGDSVSHRLLINGELGFSLVCSQHFQKGADQLEQHFEGAGVNAMAPHLANALGFAHFWLKNFSRAAKFFELGIRGDDTNPVLWSNFAAAKMVEGDFRTADSAMVMAGENVAKLEVHQDHHRGLVWGNVQVLQERANGNLTHMPVVDLWNGYLDHE